MKLPFAHNSLIIFLTVGLIAVSTAVLSFVSYQYAVGRENLISSYLDESNARLLTRHVNRIEQLLISNDLILADMFDVNDPEKWPEQAAAIHNAGLNVDQVYVLDPAKRNPASTPLFPDYTPEIRTEWNAFRANFDVPSDEIAQLPPRQPHHLHKDRRGNYFFVTYLLQQTADGKALLVCYQMNLTNIRAMLADELRDLEDTFFANIVDYDNNVIYGPPLQRSSRIYEDRFHSTLYKWFLQIQPRNYAQLEAEVANERRSRLVFITLSMLLTLIALAIIYIGWRHDRQLRQLKDSFISNVSHELKTPLSLIGMFSEMLATGRVRKEEKKQEYYRIIHSESGRMTRLVNNLLDFARLTRGETRCHFEKINIGNLVGAALEAYRYEAEKVGVTITTEIATTLPDCYADPNLLTMAVLNLLDNATKYSREHGEITVRVGRDEHSAQIVVTDRGIGIPLSEQEKIFDKFYRVDDPAILRVRGSGIGLAIIRHVARLHEGTITVKSEPGQGSEFTLRVALNLSSNA